MPLLPATTPHHKKEQLNQITAQAQSLAGTDLPTGQPSFCKTSTKMGRKAMQRGNLSMPAAFLTSRLGHLTAKLRGDCISCIRSRRSEKRLSMPMPLAFMTGAMSRSSANQNGKLNQ